jgi:hypothetical protein
VLAAQLLTQDRLAPEQAHRGAPAPHVLVQLPQLSGRLTLVSHPSLPLAVQWAKPSAHPAAGTKQTPARHSTAAPAFTFGNIEQSRPHTPQFRGSLSVSQVGFPPSVA